jgi:GNAT superfamily N-acetyltransferase
VIEANVREADLAPGDQRSRELDLAAFEIHAIRSPADPLFAEAYDRLWQEFGAKHEVETADVLAQRLADTDPAMRYKLVLVRKAGQFAAVRDHTVIVSPGLTVVHLSHVLVDPAFRRSGLAGWMRALPVASARTIAPQAPITLAAEMEHPNPRDEATMIRLRAYERAGFSKLAAAYLQPDFRPPTEMDATGGPRPLPMALILRRVGREAETTIPAPEAAAIIAGLYRMYGRTFRPADMVACDELLQHLASQTQEVNLVRPTA